MQNRGMFPYRRQGPKKRKNGQARNKMRGPQKGLPNSARDLLPLLQPATKALAQVLAGRTHASGQLGHAQTMLAQAERLIAERAHNRLNPAEREEFFEQLARLKLTLADAADEAEVQAAEEQVVKPPIRQVAQERLKEMALALTTPGGGAQPVGANGGAEPAATYADAEPRQAPLQEPEPVEAGPAPAERSADEARPASSADRAGRLHLPRFAAEAAASAVATGGVEAGMRRRARRSAGNKEPVPPVEEQSSPTLVEEQSGSAPPEEADAPQAGDREPESATPSGLGAGAASSVPDAAGEDTGKPVVRRPRKPKNKGVPEGWVIDEEGYVVPGPA